jgi:hypothetical protein
LPVVPATSVSQYCAIMAVGQLEPISVDDTTKISLSASAMRLRTGSAEVMSWRQIMASASTASRALPFTQSQAVPSRGAPSCSTSQGM